jgi:hypothetical protein
MKALDRKLFRDLLQLWGQGIAIARSCSSDWK